MPARPLAFRYLYKSGVIKENTVTVFGELGSVFQKGSDYDEEVDLTVPYMDLSNLIMYYTGTVADGTVGSIVEGSLRNLNAPVSNVRKFLKFSNAFHATEANHYYVGDIVLFDPVTGNGESVNASCWTCTKTTSDLTFPIPELANEIAAASALGGGAGGVGATYNNDPNNRGMTGVDNRGQRFITGVMPATYDSVTGDITVNPYWRESALAKSYLSGGNYYQGEIVIYNGSAYQCKSTNGFLADPQLYQRTRYTVLQEQNDAAGVTNAAPEDLIPALDLALAPNGAFGYDSSGTRYLMGVPPAGGLFSGLFWEPATLPKTPSGAYLNINWDNTSIVDKIQFYDANVVGGSGAQSIPTFNDDFDNTITTLRKIYDDNEKGFVLTVANQILSSIPAAAIKSQAVNSRVEPDNTLLELVNLGPTNSKPSQYTPAVQGLFEESIARDMLRISGYANTITEVVVTDGSSGYTSVPSVRITGGLATNPKLVPYAASGLARLGVKTIKIKKTDPTWDYANSGKRYGVGDVITLVPLSTPTRPCVAKVYRVDSEGNILSIIITDKGSGYKDRPAVTIGGNPISFLEPVLELISVDLQYRDVGFYNDMKVVVQFGSGGGAVGYAVTETFNNGTDTRLVQVKFDKVKVLDTSDSGTSFEYNISRGTNYVAGNFKKDIVALQGYNFQDVPVLTARAIGVVTRVQGGAIAELVVINNGSGYISKPLVIVDPPAADSREDGKLVKDTLTSTVKLASYLPPIENSGVYTEVAVPTFRVADSPASPVSADVRGEAYLGLTNVDVKFGGSGYSVGEYMSVSGGGNTPAKFGISHDLATDKYTALVMDGGSGYTINSTKKNLNEIILQDDSDATDKSGDILRCEILTVGGGIVEFNPMEPRGEGFVVDDVMEVIPTATPGSTAFRFKVTSVGPPGEISKFGYTVLTGDTVTGYAFRQVLRATARFFSIDTLTLSTPAVFSAGSQPVVTIAPPTGTATVTGGTWEAVQATAVASLKVNNISINDGGSGYQLGDVITITQTNATTCEAFVLALSNNVTGSVGVIAVRNAGTGFDLSKTTGVDGIKINLPTTSGTPLDITVSYTVDKIVVTNPGCGYEVTGGVNPVATLDTTPLAVTTKKAGGSTATFQVLTVDAVTGVPTVITSLANGSGYFQGDLLDLTDTDNLASGASIKITKTLSGALKGGAIIPGYRGTGAVIQTQLSGGNCSKVGSTAPSQVIAYQVTKLTPPNSISSLAILDYLTPTPLVSNTRYLSPTLLTHKPHARVKVATTDSLGSILSLMVESPGYGYATLPIIKPLPGTRGVGASLFPVSLGVSRVEFKGAPLNVVTSDDIIVTGNGLTGAPRPKQPSAIAQLAGELNNISTDPVKNPNILETLELLKPGSTSGYAQAKPNMGVSSVTVVFAGRGYNPANDSNGNPITVIEVTPPDLPRGVAPTFTINFDSLGGVTNVVVATSGRGYSKLPKAMLKMTTGIEPSLAADISLNMKLIDGYVTSGGEGYGTAPSITVTSPDLNVGNSVATLIPTMKTSINGFNIESPGSQYITNPQALVVGPGNGAEATASMGVSDIYVVNGGSGYSVGDMLVIPSPPGVDENTANATVQAVSATGAITKVGLVKVTAMPIVAAVIAAKKNDFVSNGGSGYLVYPTIPGSLKTPAGLVGDLYIDGKPNPALENSPGTGAVFSTRLGVSRIDWVTPGTGYESDATVLIQDPPSSQVANYSAVINAVGQLNAYVKNSAGSGYTKPPGIALSGNGSGAQVSPIMGVSEVAIVYGGKGYVVGDEVTFTGGNPTVPARGVVTVLDRGGTGIGYSLNLTVSEAIDETGLTVGPTGDLVGKVGAIKTPLIIEGGYEFEVDDIISLKPETRVPPQDVLNSIRAIGGNGTTLEGGKLTRLSVVNTIASNDFKAGMILKVTPKTGLTGAVAYIRINTVYDVIGGTLWHSINDQMNAYQGIDKGFNITSPGNKYGSLYPSLTYDFTNVYYAPADIGVQGATETVLASNALWGSDPSFIASTNETLADQKLNFEVVTQDEVAYPGSTAFFKVKQVLSSVGAIIEVEPCTSTGLAATDTGRFYSMFDLNDFTGLPRGSITFIQILDAGRGYQTLPTAAISINNRTTEARVITTLGVVDLRIDQRGAGYTSNPVITIEPPIHRALTAKAYARSGVFDIDVNEFEVISQGAGYTGKFRDSQNQLQDGGTYRLVGGALHQTGGSAESIDTVLTILPSAFSQGKLSVTPATISTAATTLIRGSNYRVGDVVDLVPIGATTSENQASSAKIRIKSISKILDTNYSSANSAETNTGAGILDYGKRENDEDVGAYGTGYFEPPTITILGGNQGVTLATSLGIVAVDFIDTGIGEQGGGTNYQVGDLVQMISPEFPQPTDIGVVSRVNELGFIRGITVYEPYTKGLNVVPTLNVVRADPTLSIQGQTSIPANPTPVLGVTVALTTTSSDGFIGRPYVAIAPPTGRGFIQQPTSARITPNVVNEVSAVEVFYDNVTPEYVTSVPRISIAPPPNVEKFSGWRSVRFNKEDSFEAIVQYTIAKAVSFQVDPDATLPSSYFTATAITIGGVVIPLRQSGGKGMQGRELSANRIIRRYKVKLIAV